MTQTLTAPPKLDKDGFPLVTCRRCGGSGSHSFNAITGSVCFGCSGSGLQHKAGRVRVAATALGVARSAARDCNPLTVVVGSRARVWGARTAAGKPAGRDVVLSVQALEVIPTTGVGVTSSRAGRVETCRVEYSVAVTFRTADGSEYSRKFNNSDRFSSDYIVPATAYLAAAGLRPAA